LIIVSTVDLILTNQGGFMVLNKKYIAIAAAALVIAVGLWSFPIHAQMSHHGRRGGDGGSLFLLMRAAQLRPDQKTQVHTIMQTNWQNNKDLFTQLRALREKLNSSLFSTGTADPTLVNQISALQGQLAQDRLTVFQQVWALLDSTQQSRVSSVYAQLQAERAQRQNTWKSLRQPQNQ
jgi:Spy/CpxP family protein refolding chaperone